MSDMPLDWKLKAAIDKLVAEGKVERFVNDKGQACVRLIKNPSLPDSIEEWEKWRQFVIPRREYR